MCIVGVFQNATIARLKDTWKTLPPKQHQRLNFYVSLMSPKGNYKLYREDLKRSAGPLVPYIGLYLTDLTFVEDGNPKFLDTEKKIYNFEKLALQAKLIFEIREYQSKVFDLQTNDAVQDWIFKAVSVELTKDELMILSESIQPRKIK
ncbi:ras GEF [Rozella allomycis CSF55]|uniref:Ras GEF n=1 Tax=Rozella allomycis (strain CSF55) TaxID=988480 RepID=A0A4P9YJN3_ROZAC|nr:ras GEF [Rozella allomycis CSF55]